MAWRLFGAKPLSEPMLPYRQFESLFKIQKFSFKEMQFDILSAKWLPFWLGHKVLDKSLPSLNKHVNYLCHFSVEKLCKCMETYLYSSSNKFIHLVFQLRFSLRWDGPLEWIALPFGSWLRLTARIWNNLRWTHLPLDQMAAVSQTIFSNAFSWMKMYEFRLKFHRQLFLWVQLIIFQHWFR